MTRIPYSGGLARCRWLVPVEWLELGSEGFKVSISWPMVPPGSRCSSRSSGDWGGTRYIGAALETLAAQEQESHRRRRGGLGLDF